MTQGLARLRAERRDLVRTAHPDRGGDPAAFRDRLAHLDGLIQRAQQAPPVVVRRRAGPRGWWADRRARRARRARLR